MMMVVMMVIMMMIDVMRVIMIIDGDDDVSLWYNCGLTMIINGMVLFRWRFL